MTIFVRIFGAHGNIVSHIFRTQLIFGNWCHAADRLTVTQPLIPHARLRHPVAVINFSAQSSAYSQVLRILDDDFALLILASRNDCIG